MSRRIHFNYLRPPHYYAHLFTFFTILALIMSLSYQVSNGAFDFIDFVLKVIVLMFLFLSIASIIEYFQSGEYIKPLIMYDLIGFTNDFLESAKRGKKVNSYFHKYDTKSKVNFHKNFSKNQYYFISTIKRDKNNYKITIINEKKLFEYFFLKFLVRNAIHTLDVQYLDGSYKIIRFY